MPKTLYCINVLNGSVSMGSYAIGYDKEEAEKVLEQNRKQDAKNEDGWHFGYSLDEMEIPDVPGMTLVSIEFLEDVQAILHQHHEDQFVLKIRDILKVEES